MHASVWIARDCALCIICCVDFGVFLQFADVHTELKEGMGALSALSKSISLVNQQTKEGTAAVLVR